MHNCVVNLLHSDTDTLLAGVYHTPRISSKIQACNDTYNYRTYFILNQAPSSKYNVTTFGTPLLFTLAIQNVITGVCVVLQTVLLLC